MKQILISELKRLKVLANNASTMIAKDYYLKVIHGVLLKLSEVA